MLCTARLDRPLLNNGFHILIDYHIVPKENCTRSGWSGRVGLGLARSRGYPSGLCFLGPISVGYRFGPCVTICLSPNETPPGGGGGAGRVRPAFGSRGV